MADYSNMMKLNSVDKDLEHLIYELENACMEISICLKKNTPNQLAENVNIDGDSGHNINFSGDTQKRADIIANSIIKKHLLKCDSVHSYCSEEDEHFTKVVKHSKGKYYVCFDPLDGSQNLSLGLSVGSIFGIYEGEYIPYNKPPIVAAAYCLYGYQPQFVYVTNKILIIKSLIEPMHITTSCIKCPLNKRNVVYCANFKALTNIKNNPYRMEHSKIMCSTKITQRWTGCMVSDCHRLITNGGIFAYPSDSDGTKGKLRLLYECIPFAYIMTEIGGFATDSNNNNILETPLPHLNNIHLKIGFFCGTGKYI
jgi:fructose-1,6-bisphosphatase I